MYLSTGWVAYLGRTTSMITDHSEAKCRPIDSLLRAMVYHARHENYPCPDGGAGGLLGAPGAHRHWRLRLVRNRVCPCQWYFAAAQGVLSLVSRVTKRCAHS